MVIDWTAIDGPASAQAFGDRLLESPRSFADRTSISGGIDFAVAQFARAPFTAERQTIDVSGDGTNNAGRDVTLARDEALRLGITINGLVILSERPLPWNPEHTNPPGGLASYYRTHVVGGPGAFVLEAKDFNAFGQAIIKKLIAEIADAAPMGKAAAAAVALIGSRASHERVTEAEQVGRGEMDGIFRHNSTPTQPDIRNLTAAAGFKRLGFVLLAAIAVGAGVFTAASFLISAASVRAQVMSEIRAVTGLNPILRGAATVSLFPTGSVSFDDVVLGDAAHPALTAERLTARLRFFPLLIGRVEIADVALDQPTIAIDLDGDGGSNWSGLIGALARSQNTGAARVAAFSEMRINNGTVVMRNEAQQDLRDARHRATLAGLAVNFQELRRHRPRDLERRAARFDRDARRFFGSPCRRPHRPQAARRRRPDEGRLRGRGQRAADGQGRRHASPPTPPRCATRWPGSDRSRCPAAASGISPSRRRPM